jgi:hypothetical protein
MTRRKLSHVIAAGILAALLALPGPALAEVPHHRGPVDFWSWLAGFWSRGVASLGAGSGVGLKAGPGIDPNGGTPTGSGGSTEQSAPAAGTSSGTAPGDAGGTN